jgi:multimeric flavodoxin WrbA
MILGVSGSPRKGATTKALRQCLAAAAEVPGVVTHTIDLAGKKINACLGCNSCKKKSLPNCPVYQDDFETEHIELFRRCDGIIVASPVYMMNPTGLLSNFFSRVRPSGGKSRRFARDAARIGGCIAVGGRRNGGLETTLQALAGILHTHGISVAGGDVLFYNGATVWSQNEKDYDDGLGSLELQILGRKVAFLAKIMSAGLDVLGNSISDANFKGFISREQELAAYEEMGLSFLAE